MRIEFDEVKVALHQMKTENDALKLLHQEKNSIVSYKKYFCDQNFNIYKI